MMLPPTLCLLLISAFQGMLHPNSNVWEFEKFIGFVFLAGHALRFGDSLSSGDLETARERTKRQVLIDVNHEWFNGKNAEYVAPGGVHTETQSVLLAVLEVM